MLNTLDLINKMKAHFPRWMDIRKRVSQSDGGKLLMSIAEETANLQTAINEYKKDFFIEGYLGREDQIVAFAYKLHVGTLDKDQVILTSPAIEIIEDLDQFYSETGFAFYEDGNLFFRVEDMDQEFPRVKYSIDGYETRGTAEKIHVWNVFDEFATFVGLVRHVDESNKNLEDRILNVFKRRTNSTETGLKNAILNELMHLDPNIDIDDIDINKPSPENLVKYYKEFGSVIEKLANVNRDVYRTKRWDVDTWNYALKSIDYLPHVWDYALEAYQNGVGFEDDLEISLTNPDDVTDSRITFYSESIQKIRDYVKNKNIKTDIELKLSKYDNVLKPITAKYKITASEAIDITDAPIVIDNREIITGEEIRYISDIATTDIKDIEITDKSIVTSGKKYKLIFTPKSDYGTMEIKKCSLLSTTSGSTIDTNMLKEKPGYSLNADQHIINNSVKIYANQRNDFSFANNITNMQNGLSLEDLSSSGIMTLDLTGMMHQYMKLDYGCELSTLPEQYINNNGFEFDNETYTAGNDTTQKSVEIIASANQISIDFLEGNYTIEIYENDILIDTELKSGAETFKTKIKSHPSNLVLKITPVGASKVSLKNIRYSKFELSYTLQHGTFISINDKLVLPDFSSNKMTIVLKTFTGYSPILNYIFIGSSLENASYETDPIVIPNGDINQIKIDSNCNVALVELDKDNKILNKLNNYEPHLEYKALTDQAYIRLDMTAYSFIESLKASQGRFESIGNGNNISYYMRLRKGEVAFKATIKGERLVGVRQKRLIDILDINPEVGDRLYVTGLSKSFIVVKDNKQSLKTLTPSIINSIATEGCTVSGLPDDVSCEFILNNSDETSIVTNSYTGSFYALHLFPKNSQTYIAFNNTKLVSRELSGVEIVNVFNPFIPSTLMFYTVESLDPNSLIEVKFDQADTDYEFLPEWSLGQKRLRIITNISMTDTFNYETTSFHIDKQFSLGDVIPLDRSYTMQTGEIIELSKYMIQVPSGMEIQYKTKQPFATIINAPEFYESEELIKEEDGFNKLQYSNIDEIIYIGTTPWDPDGNNTPVNKNQYTIMKNEGIIIWNEASLTTGQPFYIVYTIKIPDSIKVDINSLYKLVEYNIDAYKKDGVEVLIDQKDNETFDLRNSIYYKNNSRLTIFCSKPGFEAKLDGNIITFKKTSKNNVVAVKTGYYYMDGQEYYLFANESSDKVDKFMNTKFFNVDRSSGSMAFNKRTKNFIKNSYMDLGKIADIYNMDFTKDESIQGISKLNAITACSNFNKWNTFGCNIYLAQGLNEVGIKLEPTVKNGYIFIDITDNAFPTSYLSFYAQGNVTAYIGKEKKFKGMSLKKSILVEPLFAIERSPIEPNIMESTFTIEPDFRYYLIFKGDGIIDDIILQNGNDESNSIKKGIHTKNIDIVNLDIEERLMNDYISRLYFSNRFGKSKGTEIDSNGSIINSSTIDWGITKIKEFEDPQSWSRCKTNKINIVNGVLHTMPETPGTIETEAIYVGDRKTIKSVIFEINDILFDNMKGFKTRIATSRTLTGNYRFISTNTDNIGSISGEYLEQYIKIFIDMPGDKIINNISIYIEYKSTKDAAPKEFKISNGVFTTEILDTYYASNYRVQGIVIDSISNINDVDIQIRGAKENSVGEVWTPWKDISLDGNLDIKNLITFNNCRFFQAKITLKNRDAYIKLNNIDLKVVR